MPLFGKSKEQKIADAMETLTAKILDLHAPSTTIIQFLDNNVSSDNDTGWSVNAEVCALFCHLVSRWAFEMGRDPFRKRLHQQICASVLGAYEEVWGDQWDSELSHWYVDLQNTTEVEYGECQSLFGSLEPINSVDDNTIIGTFAGRIAELIQRPEDPILRTTIALYTFPLVTDKRTTGFREEIETIWKNTAENIKKQWTV